MTEEAELICGQKAHACVCALNPNHDGPHECGTDTGSWTGTYGADDFNVVCYPFGLRMP